MSLSLLKACLLFPALVSLEKEAVTLRSSEIQEIRYEQEPVIDPGITALDMVIISDQASHQNHTYIWGRSLGYLLVLSRMRKPSSGLPRGHTLRVLV